MNITLCVLSVLKPGNTVSEECNISKLVTVTGAGPLSISDRGWMRGLGVDGTEDGRAGLVAGVT